MLSRRRLLNGSRLYLILDTEVNSYREIFEIAKQAVRSGVDILQLRDKDGDAKDILDLSRKVLKFTKGKVLYIINDRADLAFVAGADGVHLGQNDLSVRDARKILGKSFIIGRSCQSLRHAEQASSEGADYIGFGSVYKTLTKPGRKPMDLKLLSEVYKKADIPVFAIGGIGLSKVPELRTFGTDRFAVCRAICGAKNVAETSREFARLIRARS